MTSVNKRAKNVPYYMSGSNTDIFLGGGENLITMCSKLGVCNDFHYKGVGKTLPHEHKVSFFLLFFLILGIELRGVYH